MTRHPPHVTAWATTILAIGLAGAAVGLPTASLGLSATMQNASVGAWAGGSGVLLYYESAPLLTDRVRPAYRLGPFAVGCEPTFAIVRAMHSMMDSWDCLIFSWFSYDFGPLHLRGLAIPFWLILGGFSVACVCTWWYVLTKQVAVGNCAGCGYDLRVTTTPSCPECGLHQTHFTCPMGIGQGNERCQ